PFGIRNRVIAGCLAGLGLELFHHHQGGEQVADLVGPLRVLVGVLAERRPFATTVALGELLGKLLHGIAFSAGREHGTTPRLAAAPGATANHQIIPAPTTESLSASSAPGCSGCSPPLSGCRALGPSRCCSAPRNGGASGLRGRGHPCC